MAATAALRLDVSQGLTPVVCDSCWDVALGVKLNPNCTHGLFPLGSGQNRWAGSRKRLARMWRAIYD